MAGPSLAEQPYGARPAMSAAEPASAPQLGPTGSPLLTHAVTVEVGSAEGRTRLNIHEAVLEAIPYFSAQKARWAEPLSVDLPEGASLEALALVLEKAYFRAKPLVGVSLPLALQAVQVATMLNCQDKLLDELLLALRGSLLVEADVDGLQNFCREHEVPVKLAQLARRFGKPREGDDFTDEELEAVFEKGLRGSPEMLRLAEAHLKQRSRRGGSELQRVVAMIGRKVARWTSCERGYALALELLGKHPQFYKALTIELFGKAAIFHTQEQASRYCSDFMRFGVQAFLAGNVDTDGLVAFFQTIVQPHYRPYLGRSGPLFVVETIPTLKGSIKQLGGATQVQLCSVLITMQDEHFRCLANAELLASLAVEAKALFSERIERMDDNHIKRIATVAMIDLLEPATKRRLSLRSDVFKDDIKSHLIESAMPDASDDGF